MYKRSRRRRKEWSSKNKHEKEIMCPKLLSTPIVLTKRLEEMEIFQGNDETFINKINNMHNSQGWSTKDIINKIQNDSQLNIINIEEKDFSNKNVTNMKLYESLASKIDIMNLPILSRHKLNQKLFRFNVLYKNTVEFYCISNTATIKEYASFKSISMNVIKNRYKKCHFVETLCCWLKRNNVVENLKKSCEIDELVANFMRQFHLCNPVCLCCKDCIQISKDKLIGFPVDNFKEECDDLSLVTLKQRKINQINQHIDLNRKYAILLDSKQNLDNITSRTPYPLIDLLNKTYDKNSVVDKAVRLKELQKKRTILTNACNVILHKADNVIKMAENINDLNNIIIELHYADKNNFEMTEIIELGDKGKIVMHIRKSGDNDTKNIGHVINTNNKTVVKIRLCCVPEKNKAFLRLQDKNMSPLSFLYLDTLYHHYIKKRQYYDNFCNWSSQKHRIHLNNAIQLGCAGVETPSAATSNKNLSIDLCLEDNNDNVSSHKTSTLRNPVRTGQNSSLIIKTLNQVSQPPTGNNADNDVYSPCLTSSNMITGRKQPNTAAKDTLKRPTEQSDTIMSIQPKNIGSISMQNIITNTIKSKFNDPVKNNLIREINILTDTLRPRYLKFSIYLDATGRVTASIKSRSEITKDEINVLQMIIFKTQKLVDLNLITSNESLNHVLTSLSTSDDLEEVDSNQTDDNDLSIVISKTFTLKHSEIEAVYPEQKTVQSVTTNHIDTSTKTKGLTFHDYKSDYKNPTVTKIPPINNNKIIPEKFDTQSDLLSNSIPPVVIINNPNNNLKFHQYNLDGTKSKHSTTLPVNNNQTATNTVDKSKILLQCEYNDKNSNEKTDPVCINKIIATKEEQKAIPPPLSLRFNIDDNNRKPSGRNKRLKKNVVKYFVQPSDSHQPVRTYSRKSASNLSNNDMSPLPNRSDPSILPDNMKKTREQPTMQEMPKLVPIENKSNDSAVLYPICSSASTQNTNPNNSAISTQNLILVPMTELTVTNAMIAQNSLTATNAMLSQNSLTDSNAILPQNSLTATNAMLSQNSLTARSARNTMLSQNLLSTSNAMLAQNSLMATNTMLSQNSLTASNAMLAQNSLGNNQFLIANCPDSIMRVAVSQSYSVPTPSSALTVQVPVMMPGNSVPQVQSQPYFIINPIQKNSISNVAINNLSLFTPQNNVSYKTNITPDYTKSLQPQNIESQTNDREEMAEAITMWFKAPKSKKIVKTEIKTGSPSPSFGKRKSDLGDDEILDFFGEVKKIKITKTT